MSNDKEDGLNFYKDLSIDKYQNDNEIKKVCPKQELKYKRAVANNHLAFSIIKFIRYQSNR